MGIVLQDIFTNTLGSYQPINNTSCFIDTFDISHHIIEKSQGIINYSDFIDNYTTKNGKIHGQFIQWKNYLDALSREINIKYKGKIDPIIFLLKLYKQDELSVNEIHKRYTHIFRCDKSRLHNFLSNTLDWDMRNGNEGSEISNKKRDFSELQKINNRALEKRRNNLSKDVENILNNFKTENIVSKSQINDLKTKKEQIIHLLAFCFKISPVNVYTLIQTLHSNNFGYDIISNYMQEQIENIEIDSEIEITKYNIRNILTKK